MPTCGLHRRFDTDVCSKPDCLKAAKTLGVSYGAQARAADTGRLSGRVSDAHTRHLLGDESEPDENHR